jgi:hypothetical protein
MAKVIPLPGRGAYFPDARGVDRLLRVSWHPEAGVVVLSVWRDDACVGTIRMPISDVPDLIKTLADGLLTTTAPAQSGGTSAMSAMSAADEHEPEPGPAASA